MPDQPYSNREQDARHNQLVSLLTEIREQVFKTNGRVNDLEKKNAEENGASRTIKAVAGTGIAILITYLGWIGMQVDTIHKSLSAYDITILR